MILALEPPMIWPRFHFFPRNCLNLISLDILSMGWNVMAWSTETWVDLSLGLTCTGRVASAKVLWHSNFSLASSVTSGNVFFPNASGLQANLYISQNSTHTLQTTPEMTLGAKTEGGGVLAENIRNIEEFGDKQREEVCLSVFIAYREWKGLLAWQTSTWAAYQHHFGELVVKQHPPRHTEGELVIANPHVYLCSLDLPSPESGVGEQLWCSGTVAWNQSREQSAEGEQ